MKITFLGTGTSQGVPVIGCKCRGCMSTDPKDKRLRCSVLIAEGDTQVVIDTGPDFRQQMLVNGVDRLSAVVYTHAHRDHIAGLDDVRAYNFLQHKSMDIYAEHRVVHELKTMYPYAFEEDSYPGVPQLTIHEIGLDPFTIGTLRFEPVRLMHGKLPVLGYRIGDFGYLVDANAVSDGEKSKLEGLQHLVIGALRREPHHSHFTVEQAVALAEELQPEHTWLTHISHQMGPQSELLDELPDNVRPAYDQLVLDL